MGGLWRSTGRASGPIRNPRGELLYDAGQTLCARASIFRQPTIPSSVVILRRNGPQAGVASKILTLTILHRRFLESYGGRSS